jgi:hypothetical protein
MSVFGIFEYKGVLEICGFSYFSKISNFHLLRCCHLGVLCHTCHLVFLPFDSGDGTVSLPFKFETDYHCFRLLLSDSNFAQISLCSGWSLFLAVLTCF